MSSIIPNRTWRAVPRSNASTKPLETRLILKIKRLPDGSVHKYKERLIVKGFQQYIKEGLYAPVVVFSTLRLACAITWRAGGEVPQINVSTAFLNGTLDDKDEQIYIEPPRNIGPHFDDNVFYDSRKLCMDSRMLLAPGIGSGMKQSALLALNNSNHMNVCMSGVKEET